MNFESDPSSEKNFAYTNFGFTHEKCVHFQVRHFFYTDLLLLVVVK